MKPNRKQWASVMADAALNHDKVAGVAIVTFNLSSGQFNWQSSLIPLRDNEVITNHDVQSVDDNNSMWESVLYCINN